MNRPTHRAVMKMEWLNKCEVLRMVSGTSDMLNNIVRVPGMAQNGS